jgi:predicted DNA-binding protein
MHYVIRHMRNKPTSERKGRKVFDDCAMSFRLTTEDRAKLKDIAARERRPVSNMVRILLEDAIRQKTQTANV